MRLAEGPTLVRNFRTKPPGSMLKLKAFDACFTRRTKKETDHGIGKHGIHEVFDNRPQDFFTAYALEHSHSSEIRLAEIPFGGIT